MLGDNMGGAADMLQWNRFERVGVWISPGLLCLYIQYIVHYMYSHF